MSVFAINLITGAGLGLAIDYSLFVVSRFREELATGADTDEALRRTMKTAGRSGALQRGHGGGGDGRPDRVRPALPVLDGYGGVLVALTAALVSLTVLPALLGVLGPRVNALGLKRWKQSLQRDAAHVQEGPWYRFSQWVMKRPGPIAAATTALLIAMGLPFLQIEFTGVDASVLPTERSARVVQDALDSEFPPESQRAALRGGGDRRRGGGPALARTLAGHRATAAAGRRRLADRRRHGRRFASSEEAQQLVRRHPCQ